MESPKLVRIDVWGGKMHLDLVARFILPYGDAMRRIEQEIKNGCEISVRTKFHPGLNAFDKRTEHADG